MSKSTSIFINPLMDFGFKFIFGSEADKEFTTSFLNTVKIAPIPIVDVTFIDKENKGDSKDDRALIYDLHCKLEDDSDKMRMTFLKIPKMVKDADECRTTLERWMYILKNVDKMEAIPQSFMKEPVFRQLGKKTRFAALTERERRAYNESLKAYRDAYAIAATERADGRADGRAEGRAEEKLAIARNLLNAGQSVELISSATGLTESEIRSLTSKEC